jgi:DNA primase
VFQIGFAPDSWDALIKLFQNQQIQELLKAGLLVEKDDGKIYDKFRGRIIFPIQDRRGRIIAFGGRAVLPDQKPKYLNSPETPLFHKGKELYGLNIAKKFSNDKNIIVVEGYMDVIALHQAGIKNSVATLGTATSQHHITTLLRSYDQITFCFDGDHAGREAAWKALEIAMPIYRDDKIIKFLFLPDGHDPDTYVQKHGQQAFKEQIETAQSLSDFLLIKLKLDINLDSLDGRALFIDKSKSYITKLPKGQFRNLLLEEVERISNTKVNIQPKSISTQIKQVDQWTPVRKAITLLINQPSIVKIIPDSFEFELINQNGIKILTEIVDFCRLNPHISTAVLIENFKSHRAYHHISTLATVALDLNETQMELELEDLINYFTKISNRNKIQTLRSKLSNEGLSESEKEQLMSLLTGQIS